MGGEPPAWTMGAGGSRGGEAMVDEATVREALKVVIDPELGLNVVDLGLIYGVETNEEGKVHVRMTLTTPGCPLYATISEQVSAAVKPLPGVTSVETELVWDPPWNPEMMSEEAKRLLRWGIR